MLRGKIDSAPNPDPARKQKQKIGHWQQAAFTAEQLQRMKFEPICWLVPDIIPAEGVTLYCSRPKFGKSWFVYDLCIGVTTDRIILGEIKSAQGDVLYLALEDSQRRLQRRMTKLLPTFSGKWPEGLTITTEWRRLHEGGLDDIRSWYEETKATGGKPIMVAIDVLAKVRKPTGRVKHCHRGRSPYAQSGRRRFDGSVNGSYGITGAADTVMVMASKGGGAVLDIRGRDVESAELAIQFSTQFCRWTILGTAADIHQSDQRKAIIAVLVESGEPMKVTEIVAATGMKRPALELLLSRMVKGGLIKRTAPGRYAHRDYVEPTKPDAADRPKSVRAVSSVLPTRQMNGEHQAADSAQESDVICPSVRSVCEITGTAKSRDTAAERVKSQTDQTDEQVEVQATEETRLRKICLTFRQCRQIGC